MLGLDKYVVIAHRFHKYFCSVSSKFKYLKYFKLDILLLSLFILYFMSSLSFFFFFFCFLGLSLSHMEVPRLKVESELQPPAYATATPTDPSCICDLHHSSWQCQILNPLSEARDQAHILMDTLSHDGNSLFVFKHPKTCCFLQCLIRLISLFTTFKEYRHCFLPPTYFSISFKEGLQVVNCVFLFPEKCIYFTISFE